MSTDLLRKVSVCLLGALLSLAPGCQSEPAEEVVTSTPEGTIDETVEESEDTTAALSEDGGETGMPVEPNTPAASDTETEEPMPEADEPGTAATEEPTDEPAVASTVEPAEPTVPAEEPAESAAKPEPVQALAIGDPAPPLAISDWVTGTPVAQLDEGQVHVVEFWATWCPPCRTSMPHLSKLQDEYGSQVQFIGVTREDPTVVQKFLDQDQSDGKTWAEVVTYRLATDKDDTMSTTYMQAAGQNGIPTAFIVGRDGMVEWIGHPMQMDDPLAKIVSGDWDREAAIAEYRNKEQMKKLALNVMLAMRAQKYDEAIAALDEAEKQMGESAMLTRYRHYVLSEAGRTDEAAAVQEKLVEQAWDDSNLLNDLAWRIATADGEKDLEVAMRAARRAAELTDDSNASILDTLARVYYEQGDLDSAIQWQKKAVEHSGGNRSITATLKKYEQEQAKLTESDGSADDDDAAAATETETVVP